MAINLHLRIEDGLLECVEVVLAVFLGHEVLQLRQGQNFATAARNTLIFANLKFQINNTLNDFQEKEHL